MVYKLNQTLAFILAILLLASCRNEEAFVESKEYHEEELRVYKAVFNEIADTTFYYQKINEENKRMGVFFLFEKLEPVDNSGSSEEPYGEFVGTELKSRQHNISKFDGFEKYRFVPATQYPKDSLSKGVLYTTLRDPLELSKNETFLGTWITLSRVLLNPELTDGILYYRKWQGNLASGSGTLRIKKVDGKWVMKSKIKGQVS